MTALTKIRDTKRMGDEPIPHIQSYPVADNIVIFRGAIVGLNSAGNAGPASATYDEIVGVASEDADSTVAGPMGSAHVAAGINVPVRQGTFKFIDGGTGGAYSKADVGAVCYAADDQTIQKTAGSYGKAGTVLQVDTDGVWVQMFVDYRGVDDATLRTNIASTSNGEGAALVGVEAITGVAGATAQAVMAELAKYVLLTLADPGTAQAIPVTRSAQVDMTIGSAGAETNTLAIPAFAGQTLVINAAVVGTGTRAITASQALNVTGNTIMTFNAVRDCVVLTTIKVGSALRWEITYNANVALSGP